MRITARQRAGNENRVWATTDRLIRGEIPRHGKLDVKIVAREAAVDRIA